MGVYVTRLLDAWGGVLVVMSTTCIMMNSDLHWEPYLEFKIESILQYNHLCFPVLSNFNKWPQNDGGKYEPDGHKKRLSD